MIQPEINHTASFKEKPAATTSPAIRVVIPMPITDPKPKLLDQLSQAMRSRHYSRSTETTYIHWVKRFVFFHHVRHPKDMAEPEINAFLTHLAVKEHVSASTQNQALCAIIFLYKYVINRKIGDIGEVIRARKPVRLPVVMTKDEVKAVLSNLTGDKWIIAYLMYGAGLRLMECLRLRIQDLDFNKSQIIVRSGKGDKDRITMFPESVKKALIVHLSKVKKIHESDVANGFGRVLLPDALVTQISECLQRMALAMGFPQETLWQNKKTGERGRHHIDESIIQKSVKDAVIKTGLVKEQPVILSVIHLQHIYLRMAMT